MNKDAASFSDYLIFQKQSQMLKGWIDLVFNDPDSQYNKIDQARLFYEKNLKYKLVSMLIKNMRYNMIQYKLAEIQERKRLSTLNKILEVLKQKVQDAQDKIDRALQLKVFLQWREFVKNNNLLTSYLMEEKELLDQSQETCQQITQKERFLNLLMPEFNMISETSKSKSRQHHEMSEQGFDADEDNSNSFADFKSAI